MRKVRRSLQVCTATLVFCCACSSSSPPNTPTGPGGTGGTAEIKAGAGSTDAEPGEAGQAGTGTAEAGQAGAGTAEAGGASASEPETGGAKSTAGGASPGGNESTAGSGGAFHGSCANVDSECGGNLIGTWAVSVACVEVSAVTSGPFAGCEGASYRLMYDDTLTLAADLSYQETTGGARPTEVVDLPKACVSDGSCAKVALELDELMDKIIVEKGSVCEVSGTVEGSPNTKSGTYVVSGSTLVTDGKTNRLITFCVAGDTLVVKETQANQTVYTTLTRK